MRIGDFKETYASDQAVFKTAVSRLWLGILLALLLVFPFVAGDYLLFMAPPSSHSRFFLRVPPFRSSA